MLPPPSSLTFIPNVRVTAAGRKSQLVAGRMCIRRGRAARTVHFSGAAHGAMVGQSDCITANL